MSDPRNTDPAPEEPLAPNPSEPTVPNPSEPGPPSVPEPGPQSPPETPTAPPPPPTSPAYGANAAASQPGYGQESYGAQAGGQYGAQDAGGGTPGYGSPGYAAPAYGTAPSKPSPVLSILSLIAGIVGVLGFWAVFWIPIVGGILQLFIPAAAVVLGFLGKKKEPAAKGMWLTGIILGFIGVAFGLLAIIGWIVVFAVASSDGYYIN
jgi:hypothetical protein